jgi:hypothetical protein
MKRSVNCINGLCRPVRSGGYTDPCNEICGQSSCTDAKDPGTCDLTKQLPAFTGDKEIYLNGTFQFNLSHLI